MVSSHILDLRFTAPLSQIHPDPFNLHFAASEFVSILILMSQHASHIPNQRLSQQMGRMPPTDTRFQMNHYGTPRQQFPGYQYQQFIPDEAMESAMGPHSSSWGFGSQTGSMAPPPELMAPPPETIAPEDLFGETTARSTPSPRTMGSSEDLSTATTAVGSSR